MDTISTTSSLEWLQKFVVSLVPRLRGMQAPDNQQHRHRQHRSHQSHETGLRALHYNPNGSWLDPDAESPPLIRLLIGLEEVEFIANADILRHYSTFFSANETVSRFTFRGLTVAGVATTLRIVSSLDANTGGYDPHTIRFPHDVFHCADIWGISDVKMQVYNALSSGSIRCAVSDYGAFLNQLYQFLMAYGQSELGGRAIAAAVATLQKEHKMDATSLPVRLQPYGVDLSPGEEQYNTIMTELARVHGECECEFCKGQRGAKVVRRHVLLVSWQMMREEYGKVHRLGKAVREWLVGWLFSWEVLVASLLVMPLIGSNTVLTKLAYVIGITVGLYLSMGAYLVAFTACMIFWTYGDSMVGGDEDVRGGEVESAHLVVAWWELRGHGYGTMGAQID
ncbi:hypothetical protein DRE_01556 [Drechslerella stenobrocha 248]|uniref:Uncharacterized protein n=1 Tax=Drechslerella stenobrocha 248 TaxID=1043628 RepID=W7HKX8_9PEZI|nr:hypothetical protein DRE_01556 [Drechslerella stenobrocha 248]